jgi:pimeloyl-ACP methyl ester carboxylesterase
MYVFADQLRFTFCFPPVSNISRRGKRAMPYIDVNDIRMYYEEMGSGVPFVLLHGAAGSIDRPSTGWRDLMPLFAKEYRAIHIEHRGHGRTNNPKGYLTYELIAHDVCQFIEKLGIQPVHLGGVSDGAIVALHVGMTRPELVRTLVCVGANYYNDDLVKEANQFADVDRIEREDPESIEELAAIHDRNKYPGYWRDLMKQLADNLAVNPNYSIEDLQSIKVPTLLMAGENDLWGNLDQMITMRKNIPHSEILILNHGEHVIQYTHPEIVGPVVLDFLRRHT